MITERKFASSYTTTWRELLPRCEEYVRSINLGVNRYLAPFESDLSPEVYGIVNEAAFRILIASMRANKVIHEIDKETLSAELSKVIKWLSKYRNQENKYHVFSKTDTENMINDAVTLSSRLGFFFRERDVDLRKLTFEPRFRGCGIIDECFGDILYEKTLYEVKAGERSFRSIDLRQVLVYCALDYAAGNKVISGICLLNPRHGVHWYAPVTEIASECGAGGAVELMDELQKAMVFLGVSQ